jgi:hypothetical protein
MNLFQFVKWGFRRGLFSMEKIGNLKNNFLVMN